MEKLERDQYVSSAIETGISNEAVVKSINGVIEKSEEVGYVPKQFDKMLKAIMNSKTNAQDEVDNSLSSSLVRNNFGKLIAAINEGITKEEIATSLSKETITGNADNLNFLTSLVAHMKKKENTLVKTPGYQKINTLST